MKTIGLIGGMSFESTVTYYQIINEYIKTSLGGLHSAKMLLYSVDFAEIEECQSNGNWNKSAIILLNAAKKLEAAGVDFIVICTNTMHKVAPQIQEEIKIPILHIADATAEVLIQANIKKVALLGTKYTMIEDFYKQKLIDRGLLVLVPNEDEMNIINDVIYNELCLGIVSRKSRIEYSQIIKNLKNRGAEAVILGCTEIGLLIQQSDSVLPVFDTAQIHAQMAAKKSIDNF